MNTVQNSKIGHARKKKNNQKSMDKYKWLVEKKSKSVVTIIYQLNKEIRLNSKIHYI